MCAGEPPDKGGVLHLGAGLTRGLAAGDVFKWCPYAEEEGLCLDI